MFLLASAALRRLSLRLLDSLARLARLASSDSGALSPLSFGQDLEDAPLHPESRRSRRTRGTGSVSSLVGWVVSWVEGEAGLEGLGVGALADGSPSVGVAGRASSSLTSSVVRCSLESFNGL